MCESWPYANAKSVHVLVSHLMSNLTLCHAGEAQPKWSEVCPFELLIGSLKLETSRGEEIQWHQNCDVICLSFLILFRKLDAHLSLLLDYKKLAPVCSRRTEMRDLQERRNISLYVKSLTSICFSFFYLQTGSHSDSKTQIIWPLPLHESRYLHIRSLPSK